MKTAVKIPLMKKERFTCVSSPPVGKLLLKGDSACGLDSPQTSAGTTDVDA